MNNSNIILKRESQYANRFRKYIVFIDGEECALIGNNQEIKIPITAGSHNLMLKVDWCSSNEFKFEIDEGNDINLQCGCRVKGFKIYNPFLMLSYMTYKKSDFLYIVKNK